MLSHLHLEQKIIEDLIGYLKVNYMKIQGAIILMSKLKYKIGLEELRRREVYD